MDTRQRGQKQFADDPITPLDNEFNPIRSAKPDTDIGITFCHDVNEVRSREFIRTFSAECGFKDSRLYQ